MFSDVHCRHALSSGGQRFLSLWGARAIFEMMLFRPMCSTDVLVCFHQPRREGGNQSRLPLVLASWRRFQFRLETLEWNLLTSNVFYL